MTRMCIHKYQVMRNEKKRGMEGANATAVIHILISLCDEYIFHKHENKRFKKFRHLILHIILM